MVPKKTLPAVGIKNVGMRVISFLQISKACVRTMLNRPAKEIRTTSIGAFWGIFAGVGGFLACGACGAQFEAEGKLSIHSFLPNGTNSATLDFTFLVQVDGSRWLLRVDDTAAAKGTRQSAWRTEFGCDGRDLTKVHHFLPQLLKNRPNGSTNVLYAFVREQQFPWEGSSVDRVLWLGFCSSEWLESRRATPSIRDPIIAEDSQPKSRCETYEGSGLPRIFEQVSQGFYAATVGTNIVKVKLPKPFDVGFVDFLYETSIPTNLDGVILPTSFKASFFLVDTDFVSHARRYPSTVMSGVLTRLQPYVKSQLAPELSSSGNVFDFRFTNATGRPLAYKETENGKWLARNDPDLVNQIRSKTPLLPSREPVQMAARVWVLGALALIIISPALYFGIQWRLQRCRNK